MHEAKKAEFDRRQAEAAVRAKEAEIAERERLKKQAEERDRKNKRRLNRLIDAYKTRAEHRQSIVERRQEKDSVYSTVKAQREAEIAMLKFQTDLKLRNELHRWTKDMKKSKPRRRRCCASIWMKPKL